MLPVRKSCPAVFDFHAREVCSVLQRGCVNQANLRESVVNVSLQIFFQMWLFHWIWPLRLPLQRFLFFCSCAGSLQPNSIYVWKQWGFPHIILVPVFLHCASLSWKEQLFTQADFKLPVMLRLQFCANCSLWSDVHSQPQPSLVSWGLANNLDVEDVMCLKHLTHAPTFCEHIKEGIFLFIKDLWLIWRFDHITAVTARFSFQLPLHSQWGLTRRGMVFSHAWLDILFPQDVWLCAGCEPSRCVGVSAGSWISLLCQPVAKMWTELKFTQTRSVSCSHALPCWMVLAAGMPVAGFTGVARARSKTTEWKGSCCTHTDVCFFCTDAKYAVEDCAASCFKWVLLG